MAILFKKSPHFAFKCHFFLTEIKSKKAGFLIKKCNNEKYKESFMRIYHNELLYFGAEPNIWTYVKKIGTCKTT